MNTPRTSAAAKAALLLATVTALPAQAVTCGTWVSSNLTLTNDLLNCPDQGLFVNGASGIVINLNGHTISGAPGSSSGIGVVSASNVTIRGPGVIKGFNGGISVNYASDITIDNVHLTNNSTNVYFLAVNNSEIQSSTLEDGQTGITLDGAGVSSGNRIIDNVLVNHSFNAIYVRGTSKNNIYYNYIKANGVGVGLSGASENRVVGNSIFANVNGVVLDASTPGAAGANQNVVYANKVYYNDIGIISSAPAGGTHYNKYNLFVKNHVAKGISGIEINGAKNYKAQVIQNNLSGLSSNFIDDTGTATTLSGNLCNGSPC